MKEIKINLQPNICGYYGLSYFDEDKKYHHYGFTIIFQECFN